MYGYPYQNNYQNPYQMSSFPQSTTRPVFPPFPGRVVPSMDQITPGEVPTDGSVGWFPLQDGSAVIAKQWQQDGSISTTRYVPEATPAAPTQDPLEVINDRISQLFELVEDISDNMPRGTRRTTRPKAAQDE